MEGRAGESPGPSSPKGVSTTDFEERVQRDGLKVRAELDKNKYPKDVKVIGAQLAAVDLAPHSNFTRIGATQFL